MDNPLTSAEWRAIEQEINAFGNGFGISAGRVLERAKSELAQAYNFAEQAAHTPHTERRPIFARLARISADSARAHLDLARSIADEQRAAYRSTLGG